MDERHIYDFFFSYQNVAFNAIWLLLGKNKASKQVYEISENNRHPEDSSTQQ